MKTRVCKCGCGRELKYPNQYYFEPLCFYKIKPKKTKQLAVLPKKAKIKKPRVKSENKKWKDKAWKQFSKYIRYRDCLYTTRTLFRGVCYTCGREFDFKDLQAGHCIAGRGNFILLNEDCVNAQCYSCNIGLKGNYDIFHSKKMHEFSLEWFDEQKRLSKLEYPRNWEEEYLKYKEKTEELVCSKSLPF